MPLDKIIFRNKDTYLKMYKGSDLIAEVNSEPALDYLTFTALEAGSTVKFSRSGVTSEYSTDNGSTWTSGDNVTVTLANIGDKVKYRGVTSSSNNNAAFTLTGQIKASGSVMSMINKNPEDTSLSGLNYAFEYYFKDQSALKDISELKLLATTLSYFCYSNMFNSCTSLTTIPNNLLPATTLDTGCCNRMFYNCTSLTTIPNNLLPATTLANNCYYAMFYNCTSLTTIPNNLLPATTLANNCYYDMFYGCNNLTSVPVDMLPSTTLATQCYCNMFKNCSKITQVPDLPATSSASSCYKSMFEGCSSLVEGPKIWLRETSSSQCLQLMFSKCAKLNRIYLRVYSGDSFSNSAYWLDGAASYGYVFVPEFNSNYKYSGFPDGTSGVPSTWGILDSKWD